MEKTVNKKNFEQWSGLSEAYHDIRPTPPEAIIKIILAWLGKNPDVVVDVGCGTGLSTVIWKDVAAKTIGIEPNDDMRKTAEENAADGRVTFQKGLSNEMNLPADYADVITVSQAFHWMDIDSTLDEFYRVLKKDGVLAIYDFALPPIIDWEVEKAFLQLRTKCSEIYYAQEAPPVLNDKNTYCSRIKLHDKFRYVREAACHGIGKYTAQSVMKFALSTSNALYAMEIDSKIKKDVEEFFDVVRAKCSNELEIIFPYAIVIAVK
ncbi:MAG: class I SAM-dependent methyltransferase [Defluviitaleaceae bacterium]|nr:class I SAM-dependent methyltransferase [Defluviitaleaceae bacterium]